MIVLRPEDQEISVAAARRHIAEGIRRILVQAPCGYGKTVVCAYIAKSAGSKGKNVLILVHREELASQASRTLTRFGVEHGFIMAGITTDPTKRVFIGMIDTVRNRIKAGKIPKKFDIVMPDECHHSVSPSWQLVLDHFHDAGAVIVGFSATPERLSGEPLGDVFDVMVPGPQVRELIDRGSLADYVYFAPPTMLDVSAIKKQYGDFSRSDLAKATDKPQITGDAIEHYKRLLYGKRAIVFAVNIMHSLHIVEQFNAAGIPAAHVDGDTPKTERKAKMQAFERGELWILSNVGLFGEGVDVKACEGVILLRATASLSLFIQMSMRPMRPHESKERAIIIDHVGNVGRHGLPDAYREWSLEGRQKKTGKKKEEVDVNVKQCPNCFFCHEPAPQCPSCGHIYRVERTLEQVDGELQEITADMREQMRKDQMRQQGKASTVEELVELGHSRFRAEKILQARQEKQQVIAELIADLTAWQEETNLMPFTIFGVSYRDIRFMKPKQLRELRARFEAYKAEYPAARKTGELLEYAL